MRLPGVDPLSGKELKEVYNITPMRHQSVRRGFNLQSFEHWIFSLVLLNRNVKLMEMVFNFTLAKDPRPDMA